MTAAPTMKTAVSDTAPNATPAATRAAAATRATGARSGRSRVVSRDARVPGLSTCPDALSDERIGRSVTLGRLPVPAFGLAEERGEHGGRNEHVRELGLPMQHLDLSRVD